MKKSIQLVLLVILISLVSCRVTRPKPEPITYFWEGKQVTKKKYDELLYKFTVEFVENYIKKDPPKNDGGF